MWFRVGADLVPAWYVEVAVRDGRNRRHVDNYAYVVSAVDGSLLFRRNQAAHAAFSYRVLAEPAPPYLPLPGPGGRGGFPHPTGTPDGYQPPFVAPNLVTLENLPFSRNDPWLAPGATRTIGNNAEAYADLVEPEYFGPADANECNSRCRSTATSTRARVPPGRSTTRTTSRRSRTPAARRSWPASPSCST